MIARGLLAFAALCAAVFVGVYAWARLPAYAPLSPEEARRAMAELRGALDGKPAHIELATPLHDVAVVQLWDRGRPALRLSARGDTVGEALTAIASQLSQAQLSDEVKRRARIKIDLVRARGPILDHWPLVFAFSMVPGLDGLALSSHGREALLLPDDLMIADALAGQHPFPQLELELGLDLERAIDLGTTRLGIDAGAYEADHRWQRLRVESWVESESGPLPVVRGNVPGPPVTAKNLRAAAIAGGQYLVRHLLPDGKFDYQYDAVADHHEPTDGDYSLPRHGGATFFLAQLYGATHDPALRDAASRALYYLMGLSQKGCDRPGRACVGDTAQVDLGSSALALVAAVEYQRTTGDRTFEPWLKRLAGFLLYMQLPNGDFRHLYWPDGDRRDDKTRLPYYSGEAALGLARLAALPGIPDAEARRYADAADRALAFLTGPYYDFFVGQFVFAEDHWTCIAADTLWDRLSDDHRRRYGDFCDSFAAFLRRMQFTDDDAPQPDFVGAYGFSPILPPHDIPVGSRSECAISVWNMDRRLGRSGDAVRRQILAGMQFLLGRQLRDENGWFSPNLDEARGGIPQSDVKRVVRIDGLQHAGSAILRALDVVQ